MTKTRVSPMARRAARLSTACGVLALSAALSAATACAQDAAPVRGDLFVSVEARATRVGDEVAVLPGLALGWTVNGSLLLGVAGVGSVGGLELRQPTLPVNGAEEKVSLSYAGALVGWSHPLTPRLRASATALLGRGSVRVAEDDGEVLAEKFWVAEPVVNVDVRLLRELRLNVGAGYRFVAGGEFDGLERGDLRGGTARVGLTLGRM